MIRWMRHALDALIMALAKRLPHFPPYYGWNWLRCLPGSCLRCTAHDSALAAEWAGYEMQEIEARSADPAGNPEGLVSA